MTLAEQKSSYRVKGWVLLENKIPLTIIKRVQLIALSTLNWQSVADYAPYESNVGAPYPPEIMDERGFYQYEYLSGDDLDTHTSEINKFYEELLNTVVFITGEAAVVSPYSKSKYLLVKYDKNGQQGYHRDTQPITVLLYVNTVLEGGETVLHDFSGEEVHITPTSGAILLMQGRHIRHCSRPALFEKIVLPFNYYTTVDQWRPETLDSDNYWSKSHGNDT